MRVLDEWPGTGRSSYRATSQNWMRPQMRTLLSLSASGACAGAGAPRRVFSRLPNVGVRPAIAVSVSVWIVGGTGRQTRRVRPSSPKLPPEGRSASRTLRVVGRQIIAPATDRAFLVRRSCRSPMSTARRRSPERSLRAANPVAPAQLPRRPVQAQRDRRSEWHIGRSD